MCISPYACAGTHAYLHRLIYLAIPRQWGLTRIKSSCRASGARLLVYGQPPSATHHRLVTSADMAGNDPSHEQRPFYRGAADPFIVPSPSSSRSSANDAAGMPTAATATTVIHMNDAEDDDKSKSQESVVVDAGTGMALTSAAEAPESRRGAQATTAGVGGNEAFWSDRVETVRAYQLASAALRRLPTRTAPVDEDICKRQRTDEMTMAQVETSATHAGVRAPPSPPPSAAPLGTIFDDADQPTARTSNASPQTPKAEKVRVAVLTAVSPSSSRFQVPPLQAVRMHAVQPSLRTPSEKGDESVALTTSEGESANSANANCHMDSRDSGDAVESVSVHDDEDDVATRVLVSLHRKDDMIRHLTQAVEALQEENAALCSIRAAARQADAVSPPAATGLALSSDGVKTSSPSWPSTPVRWWKKQEAPLSDRDPRLHDDSQGVEGSGRDNVKEYHPPHSSPSLSAAHAAVSTITALQCALAEKEAELEALRSQGAPRDKEKRSREFSVPAEGPSLVYNAGDSLISSARGTAAASPSAVEAVAEARVAQLEWQLQNVQQEKQEDMHTLRDHIDHLTRELHRKSRDMERQQRRHKLELAALQQEVTRLVDQLEDQIQVSSNAPAAPPLRRESEAGQVMELQRELAQAKAREALLLNERVATQQRWLQELAEQKRLLDEARADAAQEEARQESRVQQERQLVEKAAHQQRQELEEQVCQYKEALEQAKRELSALRVVHERTEETVSQQRHQLQLTSQDIATATLERVHDEQRAAHAEEQIRLLHQKLRQAEATITSQQAELESLRQAREDEAAAALALQEEEHTALLKHVKGCLKGSEAVESALLAVENSRRATASQLACALEERNEYHRLYREASVQAQAQLLEQQQLLSEGSDLMCRRLQEAQADLVERTEALETAQRELQAVQQRMQSLKDELTRSEAAQRQLGEELHAAQARHEAQTAQLVHAKEGLKDALHAQLATMSKLRRKEKQLHSQHAAAQRAMERRQEEQRALQGIVDLLWSPTVSVSAMSLRASGVATHESSRVLSLPPLQILTGAATLEPGGSPAMSRRTLAMLERSANISTRRSYQIQKQRSVGVARASAAGGHSDAEIGSAEVTGSPSRSASLVSSATASVMMSAVSWDDVPATSLSDGDTALEERHRAAASALEEGDMSAKSKAAGSPKVPRHARVEGDLSALAKQLQGSVIAHKDERRRAATDADLSVLHFLRAIRDAIQQMCTAYTAVQHELCTKRTAVRALVKERKAQQAQLEELRATLQEQRHKAERLRRDAVQSIHAESQAELEKVCRAWQDKYEAGMQAHLHTYEEQLRRAVAEVLKACAENVQAELIVFIQLLPTTLSAGLEKAAVVSAERTREELREGRNPCWCSPSTRGGAHDLVVDHGHSTQAPHASTAANADVSLLSLRPDLQPEVQAECDTIIRDVLHMEGGWADLMSAVLVASSNAAAEDASGGVLPSTGERRASPPPPAAAAAEQAQRTGASTADALWSAEEMAELKEVIHAHVMSSFSALTAVVLPSLLAGVRTSISRSWASEERQGMDEHAGGAPATVGGASGGPKSTSARGAASGEELAAALPRWMRSLRRCTSPATSSSHLARVKKTGSTSTPPRSAAVADMPVSWVPQHYQPSRLLALLLDACVAHVHAQLLA
ncbi:hypothetical protein, unknown function [Leishmania tarentolae]|uniref:Uncharacterized protein n=1 Tax=Leishmania tarentolae TaxID=5689 RepID=A0A640KGA9_LEITA|nr:hypothetical protein, unknown function [Leishmania tarentolae]